MQENTQPVNATMQNGDNAVNQTTTTRTTSLNYASFLERLAAVLIDGILIMVVGGILGRIIGVGGMRAMQESSANFIPSLVGVVYSVYMISQHGATLGKMALKIKVQHEVTGAKLSVGEAFLREVIGKFLSGIVLLIGYFWMLWDPKRQTWHDKIAKSIVVKSE